MFNTTQVNLLQRHINQRDRQLKQYRKELQEAEFNLDLYREGLNHIIDKYTRLGLEIEKPLEIKLLCSTIIEDAKKLIALTQL